MKRILYLGKKYRMFMCFTTVLAGMVFPTSCREKGKNSPEQKPPMEVVAAQTDTASVNSIYYWRTVFKLNGYEKHFLKEFKIRKLYLHFFDVVGEQNMLDGRFEVVPSATTKFVTEKPEGVDIVPVVYITLRAMTEMKGKEEEYAEKIFERVLAMCRYNRLGTPKEVQLDCDWVESTKDCYYRLCTLIRDMLHNQKMILSTTIRLYQLKLDAPPADRAVLMVYNTGKLENRETKNSILDAKDVLPYIQKQKYGIPLDIAYPVFSWGVWFKEGKYVGLLHNPENSKRRIDRGNGEVRVENSSIRTIQEIKEKLEPSLGQKPYSILIFHLDSTQLSKFTSDEIAKIYTHH